VAVGALRRLGEGDEAGVGAAPAPQTVRVT
jgi:hypothetical protein